MYSSSQQLDKQMHAKMLQKKQRLVQIAQDEAQIAIVNDTISTHIQPRLVSDVI